MKTFDKKIVDSLVSEIKTELQKKKKEREDIKLSKKENNIIKAINEGWSFDKKGPRTSWGRTKLGKHLKVTNFVKAKNALIKLKTETIKPTKVITEEEIIEKWAKRLSKLTEISREQAIQIALEKIEYKNEKIEEMEERQADHFSEKRGKLINKMERENPLRRIKDSEHAYNIIGASIRHTETDYDDKLEEGREKAMMGEIEKGEVKEYARCNFI